MSAEIKYIYEQCVSQKYGVLEGLWKLSSVTNGNNRDCLTMAGSEQDAIDMCNHMETAKKLIYS